MTPRRLTSRPGGVPDAAGRVLAVLYDCRDAYVPPEELASETGLQHRQIAEAIDDLRRRGSDIEESPAHGFRLVRPAVPHPLLIERGLGTRRVGRSVICFDEVDSTNDVAFDSARRADSDGLVVLSGAQRRGRGRLGRSWSSPAGENVLMSVLLRMEAAPASHEALTVAAGVAVAEALDAFGASCRLKWPNDVLLDGAKLAGVLVEVRQGWAVVGCGVNVNAAPSTDDVTFPATCLADALGHTLERVEVVRELLRRLDAWVELIERGRFGDLHDAFAGRCATINRRVEIRNGQITYAGRALDVSPLEGLVLLCDDGRRLHLPASGSTILTWK